MKEVVFAVETLQLRSILHEKGRTSVIVGNDKWDEPNREIKLIYDQEFEADQKIIDLVPFVGEYFNIALVRYEDG